MKLKIKSANRAAIFISLPMLVIFAVSLIIMEAQIINIIIFSIALSILNYFIARLIISRFVLYRLKPIYEIILNEDIAVDKLKDRFSTKEVFLEVGEDIVVWADNKSKEISSLKEMEQYRKEFLGNVSHELKTPLFTLQGYILTLIDGGVNNPNINLKYLNNADRNIERLIAIVKDLESISALENKVENLERKRLDIVAISKDIAESLTDQAKLKDITISVEASEPIEIYADRGRIEQVLINLIVNSIKYGKKGGRTKIKFVDMYQKVLIEVEDDGIGIEKDNLPRIFERFFRADKSRSREIGGTGLGLAIVKHIVEAHGEKISVRSDIGKGSTFAFTMNRYL
ncbi:MAG: ATP-binding protein [Rikenellaceae bacterium]